MTAVSKKILRLTLTGNGQAAANNPENEGKSYSNYRYNTSKNQWDQILTEDTMHRGGWPSTLIKKTKTEI
ncbi:hypothetical protein PPL_01325 [Heterostelium album PN500]|uniref:Uncharacterized protein n=1 Tax=Heterostelium pallidum (strain ATCC 26659 / Pp 5 / PN500) TaxID=670386 RepID=D3AYR1_HETP5|nr:hypothetical protein PPL_01325 [Heterostelium album PN500]EFA86088.1 hypothetical protein PPL_01325 [Heterostelium album PN500]|eukprot:XP_020438194.1 hypothetical protein PPL_01325 [Heterostelium album PN500]